MGKKESIERVSVRWILNGVTNTGEELVNRLSAPEILEDLKKLIEIDGKYSIAIPTDKFTNQKGIRVSCRIRIDWKEPECLRSSISNELDIK
jgi:hypothetical protein